MSAASSTVETELKFALDVAEHQDLLEWLSDTGSTLTRTFSNHYFDTPKLALKERQHGLRLRTYPSDQTLLTLKGPNQTSQSDLSVRAEWEVAVDPLTAVQCIEGVHSLSVFETTEPWQALTRVLDEDERNDLQCLGGITTERCIGIRDGFTLEVDACTLGDTRFYELEMETDSVANARTWITRLFVNLEIPVKPSPLTKLGRFFNWWQTQPK